MEQFPPDSTTSTTEQLAPVIPLSTRTDRRIQQVNDLSDKGISIDPDVGVAVEQWIGALTSHDKEVRGIAFYRLEESARNNTIPQWLCDLLLMAYL